MNRVEKALMHALFVHLHHNADKAIDFQAFKELNDRVGETLPGSMIIGPDANDDAAVLRLPGEDTCVVAKMESHCSPCVPRPYDSSATGVGGSARDVVAMGAKPLFILDFIGTRPLDEEVIVGPCGFAGKCTCGKCITMTSQERLNLMLKGIRDMCAALEMFVAGGGFSTSFSDIVPAMVISAFGKLITAKPLTKPAKRAGNIMIIIGETGSDGNDTLYRAGLVPEMRPALALFREERKTMDSTLEAYKVDGIESCSDLGAAGLGAAVCESVRFGGLGAAVDLSKVPLREEGLSPEEILICETQARMLLQVPPGRADEVIAAARSKGARVEAIGEVTDSDRSTFTCNGETIAVIPNKPPAEVMSELEKI
ncbi:MAG: phosphoribosylformylglycinamidine synthase [Firmicutes bacterium]|nr:phosphoribosylformylglycinamidine synthase [Bacillota bacterium]